MKIKVTPDDFIVREKVALRLENSGRYRIYVMEKRYWNTVDAIRVVARASGVRVADIGYGGRKDRYAHTYQYISVPAEHALQSPEPNVTLTFAGFSDDFVSTKSVLANEFEITLRSVSREHAPGLEERLQEIAGWGIPNYFDDQRFGSVPGPDAFFAEKLVLGHLKGALKLYLTATHRGQSSDEKRRRRTMEFLWSGGDWVQMESLCRTPVERAICRRLARGSSRSNLIEAIQMIPREELSMFIAAYQSFLWNMTLDRLLREYLADVPGVYVVRGRLMDYRFYRTLHAELFGRLVKLEIPTVSRRIPEAAPEVARAIEEVMAERGVTTSQFNLRGIRKVRFESFFRDAVLVPRGLRWGPFIEDDLYPGCLKVQLRFTLPPGSFGTMVVKALQGVGA